jgi:hypothetical protein
VFDYSLELIYGAGFEKKNILAGVATSEESYLFLIKNYGALHPQQIFHCSGKYTCSINILKFN